MTNIFPMFAGTGHAQGSAPVEISLPMLRLLKHRQTSGTLADVKKKSSQNIPFASLYMLTPDAHFQCSIRLGKMWRSVHHNKQGAQCVRAAMAGA